MASSIKLTNDRFSLFAIFHRLFLSLIMGCTIWVTIGSILGISTILMLFILLQMKSKDLSYKDSDIYVTSYWKKYHFRFDQIELLKVTTILNAPGRIISLKLVGLKNKVVINASIIEVNSKDFRLFCDLLKKEGCKLILDK